MKALGILLGIFLTLFLGFIIIMRALMSYRARKIKGLELKQFKGKNILLYFYSERCGACKVMSPIIDSIREIEVKKIDVFSKEGSTLAKELNIMATPTTILVIKGEIKDVLIGFKDKNSILKKVETLKENKNV